jgi:hypothetical protein
MFLGTRSCWHAYHSLSGVKVLRGGFEFLYVLSLSDLYGIK